MDAGSVVPSLAGGAVIGLLFGALVQRTHFCTMGALSDLVLFGDTRRLRAWGLALGVALTGTQALALLAGPGSGPGPGLALAGGLRHPVLLLLGGLLFGFGMTQTGGCASRTLVRFGAGNLKAGMVLLILVPSAGLTALAVAALGTSAGPGTNAAGWPGLLIGGLLLIVALGSERFRSARPELEAGIGIGLLVVLGWAIQGALPTGPTTPAAASIPAATSINVVAAFGPGTGAFLLALVVAIPIGALIYARSAGTFRVERFQSQGDRRRHAMGAVLMGIGGGLAAGCTIGHGVSGLALLAPAALIATPAMIGGGLVGIRYLEQGSLGAALLTFVPGPLRSLVGRS